MLGCDLELIEPHSDALVADYFTADEQAMVARTLAADLSRGLDCFGVQRKARSKGYAWDFDSTSVVFPLLSALTRRTWRRDYPNARCL